MPAKRKPATSAIKPTSIAIPAELWNRIDQRVKNSGAQFASISHYLRWLVEQDLRTNDDGKMEAPDVSARITKPKTR